MRLPSTVTFVLPALITLFAAPALAQAATCQVDPTGSFGMPHPSIDDALSSGGCDQPGSVIEVYCPAWGCSQGSTTIHGLDQIYVLSAELWGYGPATLTSSYSGAAVSIENSREILFEGFAQIAGEDVGVAVIDSRVIVIGSHAHGRYTDIGGHGAGIYAEGDSRLDLVWVAVTESGRGMSLQGTHSGAPHVLAEGFAATWNEVAVFSEGSPGPVLEVRSDFGPTMHNYIVSNVEGVELRGESDAVFDHTIVAGNLRMWPGSPTDPEVFNVQDHASLSLRNALIYDNDSVPNPGVLLPWSACGGGPSCHNTPGRILEHGSSKLVSLEASTIIDNQTDIVINLDGAGGGGIVVDHTVFANNWGKVFSTSSYYPGCPSIINHDSFLWDNRVGVDPSSCDPGFGHGWDPHAMPGAVTPDAMLGFPHFMGPYADLYRVHVLEPSPSYALPANLYLGPDWSVDGATADADPLDVGYHNPL
ncbi:hypothetical protein PPSIR1_34088 [Plesiocystis pacifica SIR-1]|uniref:Right handed beta helix domain-containing protein n=1 Tax=Plesiocystis pacifica SIR-1 TaxID=391625 RepID=A6GGA0_9BACT|nr:hypothetical protein [Plesiocystis pacifica]EDM75121.1 hypothetical protein PPSIR1_34088 [Plesiocystis pacifica SIR-1]